MLVSPPVKSSEAMRARTGRLLTLAYLPLFVWSLIGAGWTTVNHRFTFPYWLAYLILVTLSLAFRRNIGAVVVMIGVGWCHALGAFALLTWLRLPSWTGPAFFASSFVLLIANAARVMNSRRRRR